MNTSYQKRLASKILRVSPKRVKVSDDKDVGEALTRNDVKHLIVKGLIKKVQKKGTSRVAARRRLEQKKKGRSSGRGKRSGKKHALTARKDLWMRNVRAQRALLKDMRDKGQIDTDVYSSMYRKSKGGEFRSRKHMLSYMKDKDMLKTKKRGDANA
ncbi:MAG: 50S ribosomal protein L19e [Candidatus Aenigmarchaeota archaeon]|nr:50S ribosomal protein L19e [Candidatus Aenigmarchaeota archaeon]